MSNLSDREQKILDYMKEYVTKWGYPPTVRDIAAALGIRSTSTVHKAIVSLEEKGFIKKQAGKRRAMDIVGSEQPQSNVRSIVEERDDIVDLPVIGRIAAGTPILAEQNIEDSFPIPSRFVSGTSFMLTVRGESMIEAGIMDGDYILVEQCNTARNGDMVVAMVDGFESEATVKTFYKEDDHIRLQPENSCMSPIIVKDVKILGKVKGVFRYF